MSKEQEVIEKVGAWQKGLVDDDHDGLLVRFKDLKGGIRVAYSFHRSHVNASGIKGRCHGVIPSMKAIIVGLDIREYSKRKPEEQLLLTMKLHITVEKTLAVLRKASLIRYEEPLIKIQTGDGAFIVFSLLDAFDPSTELKNVVNKTKGKIEHVNLTNDFWRKAEVDVTDIIWNGRKKESDWLPRAASDAFSFIFALNTILGDTNALQGSVASLPGSDDYDKSFAVKAFPVECRFAVSYEDVLLLLDFNGQLNCVGSGMVNCARILSTDSGNHLLVDNDLIKGMERHGGLTSLAGGLWGHRLHCTVLDEMKVKSGQFRYADVFGFYNDRPLLQAFGRQHQEPLTHHIGSHNLLSIKSG
jgi:hypothetical protein